MIKIFRDMDELVTLKGAANKTARGISEEDLSVIKKAAIICHRGQVQWVGKTSQLSAKLVGSFAGNDKVKEYSLKNHTVLPAFIECHTHSVFAGNRAGEFELRNAGMTYQDIAQKGGGILSTVNATRKASLAKLTELAQLRVDEFVRQGVSTVEIKSGYGLDAANEIKMLKAANAVKKARTVVTFLGAHAVPTGISSAEYFDLVIHKMLPKVAKAKLADRADIFVEKGYFTTDQQQQYFQTARDLGLGVTVHAEQLSRTGATQAAVQFNAQSSDHLVEVDEQDINRLADSETTGVLLPAADFYLQMSYPPARQLIDAGVRVALATDFNPGSSPTQDLSLVGLLARLEMKMSLPEVIVAYTLGAAYALGLQQQLGSLEVGKACDFAVLNGRWQDLFYQVGHHPVVQTWKQGRRISSISKKS